MGRFHVFVEFFAREPIEVVLDSPRTISKILEKAGCDRYYPVARILPRLDPHNSFQVLATDFGHYIVYSTCTIKLVPPIEGG